MTNAYIEGFRKTAEAYGVDPDSLVKAAQASNFIRAGARLLAKNPTMADPTLTGLGRFAIGAGRLFGGVSRKMRPVMNLPGVGNVSRGLGRGLGSLRGPLETAGEKAVGALQNISPGAAEKIRAMQARISNIGRRFRGGFSDAQHGIPANAPIAEGMVSNPAYLAQHKRFAALLRRPGMGGMGNNLRAARPVAAKPVYPISPVG